MTFNSDSVILIKALFDAERYDKLLEMVPLLEELDSTAAEVREQELDLIKKMHSPHCTFKEYDELAETKRPISNQAFQIEQAARAIRCAVDAEKNAFGTEAQHFGGRFTWE